jgi:hypothetical protein
LYKRPLKVAEESLNYLSLTPLNFAQNVKKADEGPSKVA